MEKTKKIKKSGRSRTILLTIILCLLILGVGGLGLISMAAMKESPPEKPHIDAKIQVLVNEVRFRNEETFINSYGTVVSRDVVPISPLVPGKVLYIREGLEEGVIVASGEELFRIDSRDFLLRLKIAKSRADDQKEQLIQLNSMYKFEKKRIKILRRNTELAVSRYNRVKSLFEKNGIGSRANIEEMELACNSSKIELQQLELDLILYPSKIKQEKHKLNVIHTEIESIKDDISRCSIRAPFTGRIKNIDLESGQFIDKGIPVIRLADDSMLELHVSLSSKEAYKNLTLNTNQISLPLRIPCSIFWVDSPSGKPVSGFLYRIVRYDAKTRTIVAAIRIGQSESGQMPNQPMDQQTAYEMEDKGAGNNDKLLEGMFCRVKIKGREFKNIVKLPLDTIKSEGHVIINDSGMLKSIPVRIEQKQENYVLISSGLNEGDLVVVSHLPGNVDGKAAEIIR